jgi:hypothetical protein
MKRFRVRESYEVEGYTYINAETIEEARKEIEKGDGYFEDDTTPNEPLETFWDTLEEL